MSTSRLSWHTFRLSEKHTAKLVAVALVSLLAQPLCGGTKDRMIMAEAKIAKGEKLKKKEKFAQAEELFRRAIELEPVIPEAHLKLGAVLIAQSRYEEALEALAEAKKRYVEWEEEMARASLEQRQLVFRQAQEFEDLAAVRDDRTTPDTVASVASQVANQIDTQKLHTDLQWKMEEFQAISPQAFYLEGIAYLRTNRKEMGMKALENCLALDDSHGLAHYNLAVALFSMGEPAEAKIHLAAALDAEVEPHPQFVADLENALSRLQVQ